MRGLGERRGPRAGVGALLGGLALVLAAAAPAAARTQVPENDGWVTDLAGMLSDSQERSLEELMESYRTGSGHEIALLTVPSLEGGAIEPFALEVARAWGLGREGENDGALLVVAKEDRTLRIEVGRGLEGTLTDAAAGQIIRYVITPAFKRGDFAGGLRAGIEAMHAAAGGDYGPIERTRAHRGSQGGELLFFLVIAVIAFAVLGSVARRSRGGGRGSGLSEGLLWWWLLSGGPGRGGRGGGSFGGFGGGGGGGGFGGFGGGGGFSGGGASGGW